MRRTCTAAIAIATLGLTVAGTAAAGTGGKSGSYVIRFSPLNIVDTGKKGLTAGDLIVSHDVLYRHGRKVGRSALTCTITDPKVPEGACTVTWALPGGTVSGQFLNAPPPRKVVAITGGTGAYAGASGVAVVVESGRNQTGSLTFSFRG
jgi:hypothetical protein